MKNQLKELKNAVITGRELEGQTRDQERKLRETRIKLAEKKEKEEKLRRELLQQQQAGADSKKTFATANQEVEALRQKYEKLNQEI